MNRSSMRIVCGAVVTCLMSSPAAAQVGLARSTVERIDAAVETARASASVPGLSVAIGRGGEILYSRGFALADIENEVPATAATVYRSASISKPFTAIAVLQLVEQERIGLDESIREYVPSLGASYDAVTIRDLLRHTGGVRHYKDDAEYITTRHCTTLAEALPIFAADPLDHAPGEKVTYSTWGYTLLGLAIEHASGMPFDEYMRTRVFEPAGMRATVRDDLRIVRARAAGYEKLESGELRNAQLLDTSCRIPAGGFASTAEDLLRFFDAASSGRLVRTATFRDMTRSHVTQEMMDRTLAGLEVPAGYEPPGLGLGWAIMPGGTIEHGGNQPGFTSMLRHDPATGYTVALMTNLQDQGQFVGDVAAELLEIVAAGE